MKNKKQNLLKGVGLKKLKSLYHFVGINYKFNAAQLKTKQRKSLRTLTNNFSFSDTLKLKLKRAISYYTKIRNFRGLRHSYGYPVRGQRTHTNAKTARKKV